MSLLLREHAVVIAGGGPTGMMLAGELTLAGVDVAIVERTAIAGEQVADREAVFELGCHRGHFIPLRPLVGEGGTQRAAVGG